MLLQRPAQSTSAEACLYSLMRSYDEVSSGAEPLAGTSKPACYCSGADALDDQAGWLSPVARPQKEYVEALHAPLSSSSELEPTDPIIHGGKSRPQLTQPQPAQPGENSSAASSSGVDVLAPIHDQSRSPALLMENGALQRQLEFASDALAAERAQTTKLQSLVDSLRTSEEQQRAQVREEMARWQRGAREIRQLQQRETSLLDQLSAAYREIDEAQRALLAQRCSAQVLQAALREAEHGQLEERKHLRALHRDNAIVRSQLAAAEAETARSQEKLEREQWKHQMHLAEMRLAEKERQMQLEQRWQRQQVGQQQQQAMLRDQLREQQDISSSWQLARVETERVQPQPRQVVQAKQAPEPQEAQDGLAQPQRRGPPPEKNLRFTQATPPRRPPPQWPALPQPPLAYERPPEQQQGAGLRTPSPTRPDPSETGALPRLPPPERALKCPAPMGLPAHACRLPAPLAASSMEPQHHVAPYAWTCGSDTSEPQQASQLGQTIGMRGSIPIRDPAVWGPGVVRGTPAGAPSKARRARADGRTVGVQPPVPSNALPAGAPNAYISSSQVELPAADEVAVAAEPWPQSRHSADPQPALRAVSAPTGIMAAGAKAPFAIDDPRVSLALESAQPLQKQLTSLSLERRLLEDEYARMPLTAGKRTEERQRKAKVEARLAELVGEMSALRNQLRAMGAVA